MTTARPESFRCAVVVSAVDGTLVTDDKILTPHAVAAVTKLRANGIGYSINSSRPPRGTRLLFEPLGITTPVGGFNGGVLAARPDRTVIGEHTLLPDIARRAVHLLEASGAQTWVFSGEDWLLRDPDGPYIGFERRTVGFRPTIVRNFGLSLDAAAKIVGVSANFELLANCERDMQTALGNASFSVRSQSYYLDITQPSANKGTSLSAIAKLLEIPLAEIAVIGDGGNDVAMFERNGLSIAVKNASSAEQQAADSVTDGNGEDGSANAIDRIILGNNRSKQQIRGARTGGRA